MTRKISFFLFNAVFHVEFILNLWNSQYNVEFTENAWNSPSSVQFTKKRGTHGKSVEFTEMAWNSQSSVESAGVFLVMWGVMWVMHFPKQNDNQPPAT